MDKIRQKEKSMVMLVKPLEDEVLDFKSLRGTVECFLHMYMHTSFWRVGCTQVLMISFRHCEILLWSSLWVLLWSFSLRTFFPVVVTMNFKLWLSIMYYENFDVVVVATVCYCVRFRCEFFAVVTSSLRTFWCGRRCKRLMWLSLWILMWSSMWILLWSFPL